MSGASSPDPGTIIGTLTGELDAAFSELEPWFSASEDLRAYHSSSEEWSIDRILEHVSLVNHYLMLLIDKGARKALRRADGAAIDRELENYKLTSPLLEDIGVNNSFRWKCPDHMAPTGKSTPAQIREELMNQRSRLMDYLGMLKNGEGVLCKTRMSVHSLGKLDVYQYIYFLLKHIRRHVQQMEEIEREFKEIQRGGFII